MADFVKEITEVWNQEGVQAGYDRGEILLQKIAEEIRGLQSQRTTITALMQHLEVSGARTTPQYEMFESVRAPDRPQVILDAAAAVVEAASGGLVGECAGGFSRTAAARPESRGQATPRGYRDGAIAVRALRQDRTKHVPTRRNAAFTLTQTVPCNWSGAPFWARRQ